jgi:hypothetical protein
VSSSLLRGKGIGIQAAGGTSLLSYGNNHVTGNAANGSFTGPAGLQCRLGCSEGLVAVKTWLQ